MFQWTFLFYEKVKLNSIDVKIYYKNMLPRQEWNLYFILNEESQFEAESVFTIKLKKQLLLAPK